MKKYYPQNIELIQELTWASCHVVLFDHTGTFFPPPNQADTDTEHQPSGAGAPGQLDDSPSKSQSVSQMHADQTTAALITRVHRHLPADVTSSSAASKS